MEVRHVVCGQRVVREILVLWYTSEILVSVCFSKAQRFIALSAGEAPSGLYSRNVSIFVPFIEVKRVENGWIDGFGADPEHAGSGWHGPWALRWCVVCHGVW